MDRITNSVVIVAIGPRPQEGMAPDFKRFIGSAITETVGTGILFGCGRYLCVASCRHVIDSNLKRDQFKAISRYEDAGGTIRGMTLGLDEHTIRYHPKDTATSSHDVALFVFGNRHAFQLPFEYLEMSLGQYFPARRCGLKLQVWGYPVNRMSRDDVLAMDKPLPVQKLSGRLIDAPYIGAKTENFDKSHILQHIAEIDYADDLSGISGGLVLAEEGGHLYPLGMASTGGKGRVQDNLNNTERQINFVGFTSFPTIFEAL
jgi:hypothetical protein